MGRAMRYTVLINRKSGIARGRGPSDLAREVARAFEESGAAADIALVDGARLGERLERLRSAAPPPEAVIIGGGDGSVSTAARLLVGSPVALGVLPLGTFNLFARAINVPLELAEAVRALLAAEPTAVDTLDVNGRTVLQHASIGLQPQVILLREREPASTRLGKVIGGALAWLRVVRRPPILDLTLRVDGRTLERRTVGVLLSNDPLRHGFGALPVSRDLKQGQLAVYVSKAATRGELVRLSAAVSLGLWRETGLVEEIVAREVEIATRRGRLLMSLDGELVRLATPLSCRSVPASLKVLVPPPPA